MAVPVAEIRSQNPATPEAPGLKSGASSRSRWDAQVGAGWRVFCGGELPVVAATAFGQSQSQKGRINRECCLDVSDFDLAGGSGASPRQARAVGPPSPPGRH